MGLDDLEESASLEVVNLVLKKIAAGEKVISLAVGEPVFDTPPGIINAAVEGMKSGMTHYTSSYGIPEVREAIVRKVQRKNRIKCNVENTIFISSKMAIYAAFLALKSDKKNEVLVPDPGYFYREPAIIAGLKPVSYTLNNDYSINVQEVQKRITDATAGIIINTPSNPTGRVYSRSELKELYDLCKSKNIRIVSDEAYEDLVYSGEHVSIGSFEDEPDTVISIFTLSKSYSMTGWRAGYVVANESIIRRILKLVEHAFTCFPPFIQHASAYALENEDRAVEEFRKDFSMKRSFAVKRLGEIESFSVNSVDGAFYIFPAYRQKITSRELCNKLLREENVAILPGSAFGNKGEGHVRISYSGSMDSLENGLDILEKFMGRLK